MFITFEGPEGSGKTTQLTALTGWLRSQGHDVLATREPGGTVIGDRVRSILLDPARVEMQPAAEVLLFSASRAQIVGQVIRPQLARGGVVICDRFADSTLAYQGYGHGLDLSMLRAITAFATGGLIPDLTIYLDIDVVAGLRRKAESAQDGSDDWNRMERKALDFHRRVRDGYLLMARAEATRWLVIDATRSMDAIQQVIRDRVSQLLAERR